MSAHETMTGPTKTNLLSLPPELIQHIHFLALNPHFPLSSPQIYYNIKDTTPSLTARYFLSMYAAYPASSLLVRAVRHPVCGVEVVREMIKLWDKRRGWVELLPGETTGSSKDQARVGASTNGDMATLQADHTKRSISRPEEDPEYERLTKRKSESDGHETDSADDAHEESSPRPKATGPPLICPELPRRLFRTLSSENPTIPPLLEYLYETLSTPPDANSHRGYPLCRAVLTRNRPLIRFLLRHGADPAVRDGLAVEVAISGGGVEIVRLLVENDHHTLSGSGTRKDSSGPGVGKKRRLSLSTRLEITPKLVEAAMRSGSDKIVQYFVNERGVMPPLQSIMKLGTKATGPTKYLSSKRRQKQPSRPADRKNVQRKKRL